MPHAADQIAPSTAPPTPTDTITRIPKSAYDRTPAVGVPYSTLFRDNGAPYLNTVRDLQLSPEARLTQSVEAEGRLDLPDFRGRFPLLQRGFAPEDADLKLGPLYFKLRHLSSALLFSDNVNHSIDNRESDWLGIVTVGGQILAQLTEGFRVAVAGNFVYLPKTNEAGFTGFSLRAPYSFGIGANPSVQTQVSWEPIVFGLPVTITDEFSVGLLRYSNTAYDTFDILDGTEFDGRATTGIYSLRIPRGGARGQDTRSRQNQSASEFGQTYYSNRISLSTGGRLPGDNSFHFRASHTDIWYEDDNFPFPDSTYALQFSIQSDRKNLRFKPFVSYSLTHRDNPDRYSNTVLGGIRGPITDLLSLEASAGHSWVSESDSSGFVWRVGLYHRPGPYTRHSLVYARETSEFLDEVNEHLIYHFHKILGPDLTATVYAGFGLVEDIDALNPDREDFRAGLRLHYIISPKSSLSVLAQYTTINYSDGLGGTDTWRIRGEYRHRFLDRLSARLIYQHEHETEDDSSGVFYENFVYLALSWAFD